MATHSSILFFFIPYVLGVSLLSQMVKNACNAANLGLIPRLEDSLKKRTATHSSILAWRIP